MSTARIRPRKERKKERKENTKERFSPTIAWHSRNESISGV
jgi:hypothetical protein